MKSGPILAQPIVMFDPPYDRRKTMVTFGLVKHIDASALEGLADGDPVSVAVDLSGAYL